MSLTRPTAKKSINPATKFVKAKCGSDMGHFEYYEKDKNDPKKGVNRKIDFSEKGFFILDHELATIKGWNEVGEFSIISNEIRTSEFDWAHSGLLTVMKYPKSGSKSVIAKGSYSEVKDEARSNGGKFTRCIYAIHDGELIHISLSGVSFSSFVTSIEENPSEIHERYIRVKEWKEGKKGAAKFLVPQFEYGDPITEEEFAKAAEIDKNLQEYLDGYMKVSNKNLEEVKFDPNNWREFKENGKPALGSLTIQEIESLKLSLEEDPSNFDTPLYDCVCTAIQEFQSILKDGSWRDQVNSKGENFESLTAQSLKEALIKINQTAPSHKLKLFVEAAIEAKLAEQGPEEEYDEDFPPF